MVAFNEARHLRLSQNMTQPEFARAVFLSERTVRRMEAGKAGEQTRAYYKFLMWVADECPRAFEGFIRGGLR